MRVQSNENWENRKFTAISLHTKQSDIRQKSTDQRETKGNFRFALVQTSSKCRFALREGL